MPNPEKDRTQHLLDVTIHELCHAYIALPRCAGLLLELSVDALYGIRPNHKFWDGRVTVKLLDDDRYQDSAYGWAGLVGEAIDQDRANAVELAWNRYHHRRHTVSDTDLQSIEGVPAQVRVKTAQMAYEYLLPKWAEIKDRQRETIERVEEKKLDRLGIGWIQGDGWFFV
jgi:hypothetical protein